MAGPADDKTTKAAGSSPRGLTPKPGVTVRPPAAAKKGLVGSTISDRYKIERLLGEGGMGAVYQVEHVLMRKRMAIKVLHPEMTRLPEVVARFEREAMAAAHIEHPNVVAATDFGKLEDGSFFLALEYVEGKSLREVIAGGRLDLGRALHIARQIASALSRAHQLKIVHRDLKPENVMLVERDGDPDFVKVLDFGIAKVQIGELTAGDVEKSEKAGPSQPMLTQAGMVYGTPEYMAPEQALGQPVDARADMYALGIIMYEMLCGRRPFDAESKVALLGMQVTQPMPPMRTKAPDANIPPDVEDLVKRLLAKEAAERLGDARVLIDEIGTVMRELVNSGSIDIAYASQPGGRLGTNPNLISGFGPAPDIQISVVPSSKQTLPNPTSDRSLDTVAKQTDPNAVRMGSFDPVAMLGNKSWMIAAAGGLIGILVLVITIIVVLKSRDTQPAGGADGGGLVMVPADSGPVVPETSLDQKVKEAIAQIDKGNYGSGIEAIENLGPEAQNREDVHRALFKAYSQTDKPREAMREVGLVMKANPSADLTSPDGIVLRQEVRNTALLIGQQNANKGAVDAAWNLLDGELGSIGFDDLYDIAYGKSGTNYPKAQERAKADIVKADRSKMSAPLAVTVELLANWNNCQALHGLLDKAVEKGDERTLYAFKELAAPRMVGAWKKRDVLGCIHEGSLVKATTDLENRLKHK
jgi:serine/threonine-protein kinase